MLIPTLIPIIGMDLRLNKSVLAIFTSPRWAGPFRTMLTPGDELTELIEEFPQAPVVIEA